MLKFGVPWGGGICASGVPGDLSRAYDLPILLAIPGKSQLFAQKNQSRPTRNTISLTNRPNTIFLSENHAIDLKDSAYTMYRVSISTICLVAITSLLLLPSCRDSGEPQSAPVFTPRALDTYPHDPQAFTQGLVYEDGFLYESTGLHGRSSLRKVALNSGAVLQSRDIAEEYFAEGVTILEDRIIQLTWQSGVGFVYDKKTFKLLDKFQYEGEGWGITHDGTRLIMSDGTDKLRFIDPHTFAQYHSIDVRDGDTPVTNLNELEYIDGSIYANVWETTRIAIISPETGLVTSWIDLAGLYDPKGWAADAKVPNGIAHDKKNNRLFVTGKLWPKIYQIKLIPPE